jgi:hypothetical protein
MKTIKTKHPSNVTIKHTLICVSPLRVCQEKKTTKKSSPPPLHLLFSLPSIFVLLLCLIHREKECCRLHEQPVMEETFTERERERVILIMDAQEVIQNYFISLHIFLS